MERKSGRKRRETHEPLGLSQISLSFSAAMAGWTEGAETELEPDRRGAEGRRLLSL